MIKKLLYFVFGFGKKYRKREQEYARRSRKFGTSGELISLVLFSAVPLLSLWGLFSDVDLPLKVLCFLGAATIVYIPTELTIIAIVALRHMVKMKIQSKVEAEAIEAIAETVSDKELPEEEKEKLKNHEARGTASKYDLAVGVIGLVMSFVVVVAFFVMLVLFIKGWIF